ncbi:MAG TPA: hemerythrin [Bacteroidales bacterium]|nr:hemerythrin [Bacteroidales bacterium]
MAYIEWDSSLELGVHTIDNQHKELIKLINEFHEGISKKEPKETMQKLLKGLQTYTVYHFSFEENLLKRHDKQALFIHKMEHTNFINKVQDYAERVNSGKMLLSVEVTGFLKEWLRNHIKVTDKSHTRFFKA